MYILYFDQINPLCCSFLCPHASCFLTAFSEFPYIILIYAHNVFLFFILITLFKYKTYHVTHPLKVYNSINFDTHNNQHNQLCNALITPHKNPVPISDHSPFSPDPPPPNSKQSLSTIFLSRFAYPGHYIRKESYNMWSFVTDFFHL
jgi:hypothetical protein